MKGLYQKYVVQKADGSPLDPDAEYIVLRIDRGVYVEACRAGVAEFARAVRPLNPILADDLEVRLHRFAHPTLDHQVYRLLGKMLACNKELYERILDTPGFAYWFNQLCLLAKARGAPEDG
jgi:hypothetical protein